MPKGKIKCKDNSKKKYVKKNIKTKSKISISKYIKAGVSISGINELNNQKRICMASCKFTLLWNKKYCSDIPILPNLIIKDFDILNNIDCYLPENKQSPIFSVKSCQSRLSIDRISLNLFESKILPFEKNTSFIMYCGGPVWGLDWCPGTDYIAVSTHKSFEEKHVITELNDTLNGLIQIWKIDTVGNNIPQLSMLLCHEFSPIYSIKFCPSDQSLSNNDTITRLGIFGFVGCDGHVRISVIPPQTNDIKWLKLRVSAILLGYNEDSLDISSNSEHRALCFDWHPRYPHSQIVVGYSDGHFAVFRLELNENEQDIQNIYPYIDMLVLSNPILNIIWYPHADDIVIPVGFDEKVSFYSIHETRTPILNTNFTCSNSVLFPKFSNMIVLPTGFKTNKSPGLRFIQLVLPGNTIQKEIDLDNNISSPIFQYMQDITDLTLCPYTGFVAGSDTDGFVSLLNLNSDFLNKKRGKCYEETVYTIEFLNQIPPDSPELNSERYRFLLQQEYLFTNYNGLESGVYNLKHPPRPKSAKKPQNRFYYETLADIIPLSINRVSFSTTIGNLCWLASGGNLGFVKIDCVSRWAENFAFKYNS